MTEVKKAKELAELSKKLKSAESEVKRYREYLESDIKFGRDTGRHRIDLEYATKRYDSVKREIDRLM